MQENFRINSYVSGNKFKDKKGKEFWKKKTKIKKGKMGKKETHKRDQSPASGFQYEALIQALHLFIQLPMPGNPFLE